MKRTAGFTLTLTLTALLSCSGAQGDDWRQWRGPYGNNVAETGQNITVSWSAAENVVWKTEIPGRGHSSPIVVGSLIVLTSADEQGQQQAVFAFDRSSGKRRWATVVSRGGFPQKIHAKNTHASPTACSDGTRIFATFNHHDSVEAVALDMQGKILWKQIVGGFVPRQYEYGYAASPTLYRNTLIVSGDCDTTAWVKALDVATGKIVWEQPRPKMLNWSSPIVAKTGGREQLLISGCEQIASYDPASGQPLWSTRCLTMATCGTVVWDDDTVFASGGYPKKETVAVRTSGSHEVVWKNNVKCYEQSMLFHDGHVYAVDDNGVAYCWNAATGEEKWKSRLRGPVSASPVLVNDIILAANERGTTFVFKASPDRFTAVSRNQLGTETFATAAVVDNRIYLRIADGAGAGRQEYLYAIGSR